MFAVDELDRGSKEQQAKLAQDLGEPAPAAGTERQRERRHGAVREFVDDANDFLLTPFADVTHSDSAWVERGVATLLALLLYGVGLMMLANYMPKHRARGGDWRTA